MVARLQHLDMSPDMSPNAGKSKRHMLPVAMVCSSREVSYRYSDKITANLLEINMHLSERRTAKVQTTAKGPSTGRADHNNGGNMI